MTSKEIQFKNDLSALLTRYNASLDIAVSLDEYGNYSGVETTVYGDDMFIVLPNCKNNGFMEYGMVINSNISEIGS